MFVLSLFLFSLFRSFLFYQRKSLLKSNTVIAVTRYNNITMPLFVFVRLWKQESVAAFFAFLFFLLPLYTYLYDINSMMESNRLFCASMRALYFFLFFSFLLGSSMKWHFHFSLTIFYFPPSHNIHKLKLSIEIHSFIKVLRAYIPKTYYCVFFFVPYNSWSFNLLILTLIIFSCQCQVYAPFLWWNLFWIIQHKNCNYARNLMNFPIIMKANHLEVSRCVLCSPFLCWISCLYWHDFSC